MSISTFSKLRIASVFVLLLGMQTAALADYACPAASDTRGGWTPESCSVTITSYSRPPNSDTRGGWTPPSCAQPAKCPDCGVVESVNQVKDASGIGAAAGAIAGGLLGNQVGKGKGRTLATIAGAVGGGVAGHYGEKYLRKRWDVVVMLDDGTHKTVSFDTQPDFAVGDKVKVVDNNLVKN